MDGLTINNDVKKNTMRIVKYMYAHTQLYTCT